MNSPHEGASPAPRPHREDDLHLKNVVRVAVIFVLGIAGVLLGTALLFHVLAGAYPHRTSEAAPLVSTTDLPPQPRLQIAPALDLEQVHAGEDQRLTRYAWIDRNRGIAQIPIDRAMTLWVQSFSNTPPTPGQHVSAYFFIDPAKGGTQPSLNRTPLFWAPPPDSTTAVSAGTNAITAPAVTELQMRQDKAKEAPHAP